MNQPMEVLLVEDSPSDAFFTQQAVNSAGGENHLHVCRDGVEALTFLRKQGEYFDAPRPDIILLDLNMPRKDGREVLSELKSDDNLKCIPVIVLTSSSAEQDIDRAYHLHANCYVIKPADFTKFRHLLKSILAFWSNDVTLPSHVCPGSNHSLASAGR